MAIKFSILEGTIISHSACLQPSYTRVLKDKQTLIEAQKGIMAKPWAFHVYKEISPRSWHTRVLGDGVSGIHHDANLRPHGRCLSALKGLPDGSREENEKGWCRPTDVLLRIPTNL